MGRSSPMQELVRVRAAVWCSIQMGPAQVMADYRAVAEGFTVILDSWAALGLLSVLSASTSL